jgi:uncharacterized protein YigE (DUF2233 family)
VSPAHRALRRSAKLIVAAVAGVATFAWLLAAFDTQKPPPPAPSPTIAVSFAASASAAPPAPRPGGLDLTPELTTVEGDDSYRLLVFPVRLAGARFRVIDLGMGRDVAGALATSGASLVVNGGFFDRERRPEGLVVSEGAMIAARSDTLGGGVLAVSGGRGALFPAEGFAPQPGLEFAIQARPRLLVGGAANVKRDDGRAAERTALCLRDEGRALEIVVARGEAGGAGPTLSLLADMLASRGCQEALNLDGGPSTGVAWRQAGEIHALAPRGPVRHLIAVWAGER